MLFVFSKFILIQLILLNFRLLVLGFHLIFDHTCVILLQLLSLEMLALLMRVLSRQLLLGLLMLCSFLLDLAHQLLGPLGILVLLDLLSVSDEESLVLLMILRRGARALRFVMLNIRLAALAKFRALGPLALDRELIALQLACGHLIFFIIFA